MALCLTFREHESVTIETPCGETIQIMVGLKNGNGRKLHFACRREVKITRDTVTGKEFPPQTLVYRGDDEKGRSNG
jgi:hypothetical protein